MNYLLKLTAIAVAIMCLSNCKKDKIAEPEPAPEPPAAETGALNIFFEAMVGDSALVLGQGKTYTNQAGNTFNVTMFKYYISNVKLIRNDNSVWAETNSYHLVDHANEFVSVNIPNVPFGCYKAIEFMIGVDSARNNSGAQTGALDPANGMFWSWSTGYIMAKMEGTSPQSTASANKLTFHIGGFSGPNKTMRTVSPSFNGDSAKVSEFITPVIHMSGNLLEWFETPGSIDFSILNTVHMGGSSAKSIADNYADMFTVEHIHNN